MPKVKIPGWGVAGPNSGYWYQMDTPFGRYTIHDKGEHGFGWKRPAYHPFMGFCSDLDVAKNEAQIDYERRVLMALET